MTADPLLKVQEVARLFRVEAKTVIRWADAGKLPYILLPGAGRGKRRRFRQSDVEALLITEHGDNAT